MEFTWFIGFGLVAMASLISVGIAYSCYRKSELARQQVTEELALVLSEFKAFKSSSIGIGKKLMGLEKDLADTVEKQQDFEFQDPNSLPYTQASRLIQMGADAEDLVNSCGLSKAEAELLMLVNRQPLGAAH
ncbi:DUF2802 domain-containing protein [Litoribrevibacter albus]|uniref:DNA repair ATPase n=1 Tax=Litoribrevibacter albus TaxID=1473156 RepID=A0AA37W8F1_9GAMM|nr:DUF2802 domain-containing protein [Litoribrevibacter albus]GLQ32368.1 DNA repair ATPase [Litoribrevibacter albus]